MFNSKNILSKYTDDPSLLNNSIYLGVVEDIDDPLKLGRCRIRVSTLYDSNYPTNMIPWAWPRYSLFFGKNGAGSISIPKKNSIVEVELKYGDIYMQEYRYIQELSPDIVDFLKNEYPGAHIWGMDGDLDFKMYLTPQKGFNIYYKGSYINIAPDNAITIEHAQSKSLIELRGGTITVTSDSEINQTAGTQIKSTSEVVWVDGKTTKVGHTPAFSAVLGEPLFAILDAMAAAIDSKLYPTPNVMTALVSKLKKLALSDTVKVSK